MTKKIILMIVEGPTDEDALAIVISKLIKDYGIEFKVLHTDITADENITVKYIDSAIKNAVEEYLKKNPFIEKGDILKVVQIIDTDGAFVASNQVRQSDNGKTEYFETHISAKNKDRLIRRNISKRTIVHHLAGLKNLPDSYPYEIYYFSRNMEHVLHNLSEELSDAEKEELAFQTATHYQKNPQEFLQFIKEDNLCVPGTYEKTWIFIMKPGNSLLRYCNLALFFEQLGLYVMAAKTKQ